MGLLCATLAHERQHPGLAVLILVPLNHIFFALTSRLGTGDGALSSWGRSSATRTARVVSLYLLASAVLIWWYGSLGELVTDIGRFSRTGEWWTILFVVVVLTILYRPLVSALHHVVGVTGLKDSRLWSALLLAVGVWVWCDGVFAGIYQQLSLLRNDSFSQSLSSFADAAYFSTVTLSTTGYGDIVPVSGVARTLVALEIMVSFGLLGFLLSRVAGFAPPPVEHKD